MNANTKAVRMPRTSDLVGEILINGQSGKLFQGFCCTKERNHDIGWERSDELFL